MPLIRNEVDVNRPMTSPSMLPTKEEAVAISHPSQMIRVDYQKKVSTPSSTPSPVNTTTTVPLRPQLDRSSTSPVSSIQEEFYSYLGISSKSSGDSDIEPSTTSPLKSPLDEFDPSKRRSLRVRVVNKLKEHQAKLQKMAEESGSLTSPPLSSTDDSGKESQTSVMSTMSLVSLRTASRLGSHCSISSTGSTQDAMSVSPSHTILARRCYFKAEPSPSPTPIPSQLIPPSCLLPPCQVLLPRHKRNAIFEDFEEEIKKHVPLISSTSSPPQVPQPPETSVDVPEPSNTAQNLRKSGKKLIIKKIIRKTGLGLTSKKMNQRRMSLKLGPCSVKLKKFQLKRSSPPSPMHLESPVSTLPPSPPKTPASEFRLVGKHDDVTPYTVLDSHLPRETVNGPILGTFYNERERVLIVVTENKVSFFKRHTNVAIFQKIVPHTGSPTKNGHTRKPHSVWSQIDSVDRMSRDVAVKELMFEKRIMGGGEDGGAFVYVELRAQPLLKDKDYRTGDMCATYVNVYYLSRDCDDDGEWVIEAKTIALDTIVASPEDISYVVLPGNERTLVMTWTERSLTKKTVGICKYKLSEDLSTLEKVQEFQRVDGELNGVRWGAPNFIIGTGNNQISIWDTNSGLLLSNIVLTDFELGDTIYARVLNVDKQEKHLLLVQYWKNYLNVVHVNLLDYAYRVLKSRELSCGKETVQSVVPLDAGDGANVILGLVTRDDRGETLQLFDALTNRLVVMHRQGWIELDGFSRLFLNGSYLIKVGDKLSPESISLQPVNEFLFNLI